MANVGFPLKLYRQWNKCKKKELSVHRFSNVHVKLLRISLLLLLECKSNGLFSFSTQFPWINSLNEKTSSTKYLPTYPLRRIPMKMMSLEMISYVDDSAPKQDDFYISKDAVLLFDGFVSWILTRDRAEEACFKSCHVFQKSWVLLALNLNTHL